MERIIQFVSTLFKSNCLTVDSDVNFVSQKCVRLFSDISRLRRLALAKKG